MKRTIAYVFILTFLNSFVFGQMTAEKWNEDIEFLKENLANKHYNLFTIRTQEKFNNDLDKIIEQLDKTDNLQITLELQQAIAKQGDSHTKLIWQKSLTDKKIIAARAEWFKDGYYFVMVNKEHADMLGKKLININDFPIAQVSDSLSTLFTCDNESIIKNNIPRLLINYQILDYFGFSKDHTYKLTYEDGGEQKESIFIPEIPKKENTSFLKTKKSKPFYLQNSKEYFIDWYFADRKIYYIQYNRCISKENPSFYKGNPEKIAKLPSFVDFENKILATLENEKVNKIIFDLRMNEGGDSSMGTRLINKIISNPEINKKGKIFVVLGRNTFSSAIINAMDFKKSNAIFIGEETSGKPNHFGEIDKFTLPNSGLIVYYSKNYFKKSDEDLNSLKPDFDTSVSIEDAINGIDPSFEFVKKY